ncbi:MAG: VWA domain-containing protein, partial [Myxococcales bacterium]|nr:VWA domain-containing protein [Myxococcales bacterium]
AISFVLDYSGSMSSKDKAFLEEALLFFLEQLPPVYRASVTKFDNRVSTYQELTRDVEKLKSAITRPMSSGGTALYDAIGAGIEELRDESVPFRLQLVFTDGMENSSKHHCHDSVVAFSRQQAVPVFVMGMGDIDVPAMLTLTNDTNACFLYAPSSDQIKQIYQVIASVMAQTYVISWPLRHSDATTVTIDATTPAGPVGDSYTIKP